MSDAKSFTEQDVAKAVSELYERSRPLKAVRKLLDEHQLQGWLFGGAIRDAMLGEQPNDLDVVVVGNKRQYDLFEAATLRWPSSVLSYDQEEISKGEPVSSSGLKKHNVGVSIEGVDVDCWHVNSQRGLRNLPPQVATIDKVPETTFLTMESVVATFDHDPAKVQVIDRGFLQCMRTGVIGCRPTLADDIIKAKYVVKSLALCKGGRFRLSPDLHSLVNAWAADMTVGELMARQRRRYHGFPLDDVRFMTMLDMAQVQEAA